MKIIACLILAACSLTLASAAPKKTVLKINDLPTAPFPLDLTRRGILEGEAEAIVSISPDGHVGDWLVTAYSDPAFGKMAADLLPELECTLPAQEEPRINPARIRLRFAFETRGVIVSQTINDTVDRLVTRVTQTRRIDKIALPRQLDRPLTTQHTVAPRFSSSAHESTRTRVVLEFLVDESGRVRMPVLHAGENYLFANAATDALLAWQFAPPTSQGRPVIVSARQEFILTTSP